ncbi:hypothetical protein F9K79_03665 [Ochrobactrum sp. Kaboul]|nr:hypothetical protein F9K79_03665 [Ochrobactrum sp. Kaboul]
MVSLKREYNGEEKTFTVADPLLFEVLTPNHSTYAYLQKFTAGLWSISDVAFVISFALHGPTPDLVNTWPMHKRMMREFGSKVSLNYKPHPDVVATVSKMPGEFAPIAVDILTELVFGEGASVEADDE